MKLGNTSHYMIRKKKEICQLIHFFLNSEYENFDVVNISEYSFSKLMLNGLLFYWSLQLGLLISFQGTPSWLWKFLKGLEIFRKLSNEMKALKVFHIGGGKKCTNSINTLPGYRSFDKTDNTESFTEMHLKMNNEKHL